MTSETPSVTERRQRHERELERAGGPGTDRGQALLDRWHRDDLRQRAARNDTQDVTREVEHTF